MWAPGRNLIEQSICVILRLLHETPAVTDFLDGDKVSPSTRRSPTCCSKLFQNIFAHKILSLHRFSLWSVFGFLFLLPVFVVHPQVSFFYFFFFIKLSCLFIFFNPVFCCFLLFIPFSHQINVLSSHFILLFCCNLLCVAFYEWFLESPWASANSLQWRSWLGLRRVMPGWKISLHTYLLPFSPFPLFPTLLLHLTFFFSTVQFSFLQT